MARDFRIYLLFLVLLGFVCNIRPLTVLANPYFYITGTSSGVFKTNDTWSVILSTDGQTLTAAQTVVHFDQSLFTRIMLSNLDSKCSFWAPADPSLGFGNGTTPYFLDDNKIVISCGFSNPGYTSTTAQGDPVLAFTLNPYFLGTSEFTLSDTAFRYIDSIIAPGQNGSFEYSVISTEEAALATPSPTPVPTPTPPAASPLTLKSSDLTLQRPSASRSGTSGLSSATYASAGSQVSIIDNTIPPPPDMTPRPNATPRLTAASSSAEEDKKEGDVLSLQSLRELLIPGKSTADKNLVLFNLVMMLIFITALAVLIWRLMMASRTNQMKYKHMNEMLEGEIAVIQSKLEGVKQGTSTNEELTQSFEDLKKELMGKSR